MSSYAGRLGKRKAKESTLPTPTPSRSVVLNRECRVCHITFGPNDKALWCDIRSCPMTSQRTPTEAQAKRFTVT